MFEKARLKLTLWYLLIIMLISVGFSVVIFEGIMGEVERFEAVQRVRFGGYVPRNAELLEETRQRVFWFFILVDGVIMVTAGGLGYVLAGRTLKPIAEMVEEQKRFVGDASHELKTPLTSLKTALEVYLRGKDQTLAEAQKIIRESVGEVDKLQSLSESLLQLNCDQNQKETLLAKEVVLEAVEKIKPQAKQKKIGVLVSGEDFKMDGDRQGLVDLVVILLDNAIKYSQSGKKVLVKTDGVSMLTVEDHGMGIPPKDLPHIFDRFYRADVARSKNDAGGYGLGLAIAKKIVENHKGTIAVESTVGKETKITVNFPV